VAQVKLENYLPLVAKKAWSAWYKLPPQARTWNDPEDLIQDGILYARRKVLPNFNPRRANFLTFITISMENYYKNVLNEFFTQKRHSCTTVPLNERYHIRYRLGCRAVSLCQIDETEQEIQAVETLHKVFAEASPLLKKYLERWLVTKAKVHVRGHRFDEARLEVRDLSRRLGFTREDFEFLLYHDTWRKSLPLTFHRPKPVD
jgi:hypothetical protein